VSPYTLEEMQFEQSGPGIDGALIDYAAKGSSVEVAGVDDIDKRQAYHLIVRTASGEAQHVWVDAKTFLEIRYDRPVPAAGAALTPDPAGASRTVSVVYRDYKTFEGLKIPSIIETGVKAGNTPDRMVIEQVVLNPHLDARTFSEPGTHDNRLRAADGQRAFPPPAHHPSGTNSLPAWLSSATQAGPQAPSPGAAAPAPAEANTAQADSPPQPGSSSASGQNRE
jgi:hypothetical protein